jgi:hypothetical protein
MLWIDLFGSPDPNLTGSYVVTADPAVPRSPDAGRGAALSLSRGVAIEANVIANAVAGAVVIQAVVDGGGGACGVAELSGTLSVTMQDGDGGTSELSGNFDTTLVCDPP